MLCCIGVEGRARLGLRSGFGLMLELQLRLGLGGRLGVGLGELLEKRE